MLTRVRISVLLLVATGLGVVGVVAGLTPSSAEPGGLFVYCGRALFGRPSTLPDPACAGAYAPLDAISVIALTMAGVVLLLILGLLVAGISGSGKTTWGRRVDADRVAPPVL
jgi:hypothetical protein